MSADAPTTWTTRLVLRVAAFVIVAFGGAVAVLFAIDGWAAVGIFAAGMSSAAAFSIMLAYAYRREQD